MHAATLYRTRNVYYAKRGPCLTAVLVQVTIASEVLQAEISCRCSLFGTEGVLCWHAKQAQCIPRHIRAVEAACPFQRLSVVRSDQAGCLTKQLHSTFWAHLCCLLCNAVDQPRFFTCSSALPGTDAAGLLHVLGIAACNSLASLQLVKP